MKQDETIFLLLHERLNGCPDEELIDLFRSGRLRREFDRLDAATRELRAAWGAIPQGARDLVGDVRFTLKARPG